MKKWLLVSALTLLVAIAVGLAAEPAPQPSPSPSPAPSSGIPEEIACSWENPKDAWIQNWLQTLWEAAQVAAGKKVTIPRPKVCARAMPVPIMINEVPGLLCGYYEPSNNTVLLVLDPPICGAPRCVVIHEYLHAIVGPGHKGHSEIMQRAGCPPERE